MDTDSNCLLKTSLDEQHTQVLAVFLRNLTGAFCIVFLMLLQLVMLQPFFGGVGGGNKDLFNVKMNVVVWNLAQL